LVVERVTATCFRINHPADDWLNPTACSTPRWDRFRTEPFWSASRHRRAASSALPRPEEPAKFRDSYQADFAVIVGPAFSDNVSLVNELEVHGSVPGRSTI
jgi:hypothetical protein